MTDQPKPLWQLMHAAHEQDTGSVLDGLGNTVLGQPDRHTRAAEIEAVRDWLVPFEDLRVRINRPGGRAEWWHQDERQRLRALLTEQARIAREGR
jgi:hypothetical protein